jgi:hypothetical protein
MGEHAGAAGTDVEHYAHRRGEIRRQALDDPGEDFDAAGRRTDDNQTARRARPPVVPVRFH